jgi:hypothetical protein
MAVSAIFWTGGRGWPTIWQMNIDHAPAAAARIRCDKYHIEGTKRRHQVFMAKLDDAERDGDPCL